jgi:hypothetical protein
MLEILNSKRIDSTAHCRTGLPSMRRLALRLKQADQGRFNALPMCFSVHNAAEIDGAPGFGRSAPLPSIGDGSYSPGSLQSRK